MSKSKKQNNRFINYWPYALIIGIFFVLNISSFTNSGSITTTPSKFFKFLKDGDVKKVEIINTESRKGVDDFVDFNIGYDTSSEAAQQYLKDVWKNACKLSSTINSERDCNLKLINNVLVKKYDERKI